MIPYKFLYVHEAYFLLVAVVKHSYKRKDDISPLNTEVDFAKL